MAAELKVGIGADNSELNKGLRDAEGSISGFANKIAGLGQKLTNIGGALGLGITLPVLAAGKAAYSMAADFEDAMGATSQIFKNASKDVQDWSNSLPTYFGIAKSEALEYSNMMGSMLKNIGGLTSQEASKQSAKLIELAGDLTAMYGGTTADAVRALTGALKGNNTMLDNYGMAASDALVKTKALEMGLIKQGQEMSLASKQAATLALIYQQSGAATGQAAREAEGASGSMRALKTEIKNLTTELGANLLPIMAPITNAIKNIIAGVRELDPSIQRTIVVVAGLAAAIGPLLVGLGGIMQLAPTVTIALKGLQAAMLAVTGPIGAAVLAIAGLTAAYFALREDTETAGDRQRDFAKDLSTANAEASAQVATIRKLYEATQNTNLSLEERKKAILELQKTYPAYFANISNETILNGGAVKSYNELANSIYNVARAKAAQKQIDIITEKSLNKEIKLRKRLDSAVQSYKAPKAVNLPTGGFAGGTGSGYVDEEAVKKNAQKTIFFLVKELKALGKATEQELKFYNDIVANGFQKVVDTALPDLSTPIVGAVKTAKEKVGVALLDFGKIFKQNLSTDFEITNPLDGIFSDDRLKAFDERIKGEVLPRLRDSFTAMQEEAALVKMTFADLAQGIEQAIASGLADIVTDAFSAIGEAIGSGGNVINAIGQSLLASFSGFLSNMGKMMAQYGSMLIAYGIAENVLKRSPEPMTKIAAGIALVGIGAALSVAGGLIKGASSAGSGGGSYSGSAGSPRQSYTSSYSSGGGFGNGGEVNFRISGNDLVAVLARQQDKNSRLGG